ncbi:MAG: CoA-binding protein [Anaerolineae bacterium]|jgi:predicted CoA-binding protein|nr:CoA-binding protein [Anaerolineae bacterium]
MSTTTVRGEIDAFLASQRLAVIGVSRDPKEFGQSLYRDLRKWGYDARAVSPHLTTIGDAPAYARVQEIDAPIDAALLLTAPSLNEQIVRDCAEAGIKRVWFYGVSDRSSENEAAIAYCREKGIAVIPGYCPYMFIPKAPFFHKIHGFVARVTGQCPR